MVKLVNRLLVFVCLLSITLAGSAAPASAASWQDKVDPWVMQTASGGQTEFLVYLTAQADLSAARNLPTKVEKGTYVYQALSSTAERTQKNLITALQSMGVEYQAYWIVNAIWVRGSLDTVQALAQRADGFLAHRGAPVLR